MKIYKLGLRAEETADSYSWKWENKQKEKVENPYKWAQDHRKASRDSTSINKIKWTGKSKNRREINSNYFIQL